MNTLCFLLFLSKKYYIMNFPIIKKTNKLERIFLLAALLVFGLIIGSVLGVIFPIVTGSDIMGLNSLRFMQISSQIFTFVLPPIVYALLIKENPFKSLGFNKTTITWLFLGVAMMYAILPLNSVFAEWNANIRFPDSMTDFERLLQDMQERATEIMERFVNVTSIGGLILNLFMIAGLAALGEELLFRSIIQTSLIKVCKNAHIGIIIASAIFSIIHMEFYGLLPRFVLGMLLGYMYYYSRSIWIPIAMHFANNGTIVFLYYLNNIGTINIDVESFGKTNIFVLILSIIAMIALFWFTIKLNKKEKLNTDN